LKYIPRRITTQTANIAHNAKNSFGRGLSGDGLSWEVSSGGGGATGFDLA
jgi:hypothetical protein